MHPYRTLITSQEFSARELVDRDIPMLQQFFSANPDYFVLANGFPVRDDEAQREFDDLPPPEMPFNQRYMIGFYDNDEKLVGMANVLSDFLAPQVWQISFFIVATSLHGTGSARNIYSHLEHWVECDGAQWIRLGVIINNYKAERFWEKCGYTEIRQRTGVKFGNRVHNLRVMVKSSGHETLNQYLNLVARAQPDS